jgi:hypothetical protein
MEIDYTASVMNADGTGLVDVDLRDLDQERLTALRAEAGAHGDADLVRTIDAIDTANRLRLRAENDQTRSGTFAAEQVDTTAKAYAVADAIRDMYESDRDSAARLADFLHEDVVRWFEGEDAYDEMLSLVDDITAGFTGADLRWAILTDGAS